jgi:hypothetical protein
MLTASGAGTNIAGSPDTACLVDSVAATSMAAMAADPRRSATPAAEL